MQHIFLYSFSVFVYTVALFVAGLFVGQAMERSRNERRRGGGILSRQ
jgi:hypothetical protein